jgi:hypothetical protein
VRLFFYFFFCGAGAQTQSSNDYYYYFFKEPEYSTKYCAKNKQFCQIFLDSNPGTAGPHVHGPMQVSRPPELGSHSCKQESQCLVHHEAVMKNRCNGPGKVLRDSRATLNPLSDAPTTNTSVHVTLLRNSPQPAL